MNLIDGFITTCESLMITEDEIVTESWVISGDDLVVNLNNWKRKKYQNILYVTSKKPIKKMSERTIQDEIKRILNKSELETNVFPHLLRHSVASNGYKNGMKITSIQKILGHSNLKTTQLYTKISDDDVEYEYRKHMNS